MSTKDAEKAAIILAWGKAIALVIGALVAFITAIAAIVWKIF